MLGAEDELAKREKPAGVMRVCCKEMPKAESLLRAMPEFPRDDQRMANCLRRVLVHVKKAFYGRLSG